MLRTCGEKPYLKYSAVAGGLKLKELPFAVKRPVGSGVFEKVSAALFFSTTFMSAESLL